MKSFLRIFLSLFFFLTLVPLSVAKESNSDELFKKARSLTFNKKYDQADILYESFVPTMKKKFGANSAKLRDVYYNWAKNCQANGQHVKTIGLLKKLITDKTSTGNSAEIYDLMADSYMQTKEFKNAIPAYKKGMKLAGTSNFRRIYYLSKLAPAYEAAKDFTNAEQTWKKALKLADVDLGSREEYVKLAQKHPMGPKHALEESVDSNILELVDSLHGLGAFYSNQDKYAKAEPYFKRAKAVVDVWVPLTFKNPKFFFDYSKVLKSLNKKEQARKIRTEGKKIQAALIKRRI